MKYPGKKYPGKVTISRCSSNQRDDYVSITLVDEGSHCLVAEITLNIKEYGDAICGLAHIACEFEWVPDAPVGKILETKTELVLVPDYSDKASIKKAIAEYEVDGWVGRLSDATNHHRHAGDNRYRVSFRRYVEPKV